MPVTRVNDRNPYFGENVRKLRLQFGLSQEELADALKLNVENRANTVSSWENNRREPSFNTLCKIAEFFGTTTDCLLGREKSVLQEDVESLILRSENKISDSEKELLMKVIKVFMEK